MWFGFLHKKNIKTIFSFLNSIQFWLPNKDPKITFLLNLFCYKLHYGTTLVVLLTCNLFYPFSLFHCAFHTRSSRFVFRFIRRLLVLGGAFAPPERSQQPRQSGLRRFWLGLGCVCDFPLFERGSQNRFEKAGSCRAFHLPPFSINKIKGLKQK